MEMEHQINQINPISDLFWSDQFCCHELVAFFSFQNASFRIVFHPCVSRSFRKFCWFCSYTLLFQHLPPSFNPALVYGAETMGINVRKRELSRKLDQFDATYCYCSRSSANSFDPVNFRVHVCFWTTTGLERTKRMMGQWNMTGWMMARGHLSNRRCYIRYSIMIMAKNHFW